MRDDVPEVSTDPVSLPPGAAIDMTVFSQLVQAAQQAGLGVNVDAINSVRDREFRDGRYQRAFDVIEGLSMQLQAAAARRQGELRQQEMRYKSGTIKMSPKEWMLRQRQETEKSQKIDRARRQFARVLDALNSLRASKIKEIEESEPK
jgi:hypothetical protein